MEDFQIFEKVNLIGNSLEGNNPIGNFSDLRVY
jgi:hypothetical protein